MSSYDAATRREFLQFMTGSPKLPIGGGCLRIFAIGILLLTAASGQDSAG
jgi:hypothetical protein